MPRKGNTANLKPVTTEEEAREKGRRGGIASGKTRKAVKTFKEALMEGLTAEEQEVMLKALKRNAMRGNLPSFEFLLKMEGQHPDQNKHDEQSDAGTGIVLMPERGKHE